MKTRMEKYQNSDGIAARSEKNKKLYDEIQDMNIDYIDINIDNAINLENNNDLNTREAYKKQRELSSIIPTDIVKKEVKSDDLVSKEDRIYDINEILKLARENKLFDNDNSKKRMINTEYNILTKLDIDDVEDNEFSKDNIHDLIDSIYKKEEQTKENKKIVEPVAEGELFEDLSEPSIDLNEEVSKEILDKEDVVDVSSDVKDIDDNDEDLKTQDVKQMVDTDTGEFDIETSKSVIFIIIVVVILLLVALYLILSYFKII